MPNEKIKTYLIFADIGSVDELSQQFYDIAFTREEAMKKVKEVEGKLLVHQVNKERAKRMFNEEEVLDELLETNN